MKKLLLLILLSTSIFAFTIGGAYATLESCEWTQYGYEYGYVGTYNVNGNYYTVFFGDEYCEY